MELLTACGDHPFHPSWPASAGGQLMMTRRKDSGGKSNLAEPARFRRIDALFHRLLH